MRPWLRVVAIVAVGAAAGMGSLLLAPACTADLGPGTVSLRARCCGGGETELLVPPVAAAVSLAQSV